jgi:hypothetical protein
MVDILVQWSCADSVFGLGVGHAMERTILARKRNCEVLKKAVSLRSFF